MTKLSVLNLVPVRQGHSYQETIAEMKRLAQRVEELGYHRYWIGEHHNTKLFACSSTLLLIQEALSATKTLRVGSGGIMLPNHSPYMLAEQFGTLAALYPNRLDLGLGRAPGTDMETAQSLRRKTLDDEEHFKNDILELRSYLEGTNTVHAYPGEGQDIPFYVLGSSTKSALLAAQLGLPYVFAGHFAPQMMEEALSLYRLRFQPSKYLEQPYAALGANVIMADTQKEADYLATTQTQAFVDIVTGQQRTLCPPVKDSETVWKNLSDSKHAPHFGPVAFSQDTFISQEKKIVERMSELTLIGDKKSVYSQLLALKMRVPIDELIVATYIYDETAQHHSFELLAELAKEKAI